jgi:hypothetical protein
VGRVARDLVWRGAALPESKIRPANRCERSKEVTSEEIGSEDSNRKALPRDLVHDFTESVQLGKRGVQIRSNPNALELFVYDRDGEDVVFVKEVFRDRFGIGAVDVDVGDGAGLFVVERGVEPNLGNVFEFVHPITRQESEPGFFAFGADRIVKQ